MAQRRDYYAELEVAATASFEEVRAAYRRLARAHHPDVNPSEEAAERMRRINEAWEVLRDPARRAEYDRSRPAGAARAFAGARGTRPGPAGAAGQGTARPRARPSGAARQAPRPRPAEPPPQDGPPGGAGGPRIDGAVDWYGFLGVPAGASREAVRQAIADLAEELLGSGVSGERVTKQRQRLREAWAILGDERLRAAYDRAREEHLRMTGAAGPGTGASPARENGRVPAGWRQGPVAVGGLTVEAGADLRGADLRGADLRGLDLAGCDLRGAALTGANLEACSLRRANLGGARLDGALLRWADLSHARCEGASLRQADLGQAALAGTLFARADLSGATIAGAVGPGVNFEFANLARADFSGALVTPSLIARGRLESTVFPDGSVRG
ncbi:DnaJ domain-containing protein [Tepidiforma flava]|uniref:DnaJ domain-containing protein n=1 Tax=Tepidiforma flava TaxID=3004094 RepID=A0ABY7MBI3_9CHLR|nr:DnaJ domain-containing protein [Tepidiforma flava]WBL36971.1 DnaJ domain-containing protein [Tepidiforma flava]